MRRGPMVRAIQALSEIPAQPMGPRYCVTVKAWTCDMIAVQRLPMRLPRLMLLSYLGSCLAACLAASAWSADLTGNWAVRQDQHDGTERRTYFDLKENRGHITGHIRDTQFYYAIKEDRE